MATFNTAHHESGGVILFSGELILLFCDNVHIGLPQTSQKETGRLYLTTHRMIFTSKDMRGSLKSFSAPFYSMHDLGLEQPIFGANFIKGKVKDANTNNSVDFKLKFYSGGAIEYGQALQNAARLTRNMAAQNAYQPPPPYTASASQYYQAPPTVYQPAYNVGFVLPTDVFNQAPPAGFIYTSEAPPPYPGLGPQQPQNGAPGAGGGPGYPPTSNPYPGAQAYPPTSNYPAPGGPGFNAGPGFAIPPGPGFSQPGFQPGVTGYGDSQPGYPPANQSGYPPSSQPGYPQSNQPGYPPTSQPGYPPSSQPGYPGSAPPSYPGPPSGQPNYPAQGGYPNQPNGYVPQSYNPQGELYPQASAPMMGSPEKKNW